jgi:hypothetical protein
MKRSLRDTPVPSDVGGLRRTRGVAVPRVRMRVDRRGVMAGRAHILCPAGSKHPKRHPSSGCRKPSCEGPEKGQRQLRVSGTKRTGSTLRVTVRPSESLRISSKFWFPPWGPTGAMRRPPGAS